jgi:hypothetical protein
MNWDAIGAIGEILGAIAVIGSLIFLALQVRQNNAQQKIQALMDAAANHISKYEAATASDEKAENFRNGLRAFSDMAINERAKFHSTMTGLVAGFVQVWRLYNEGSLIREDYEAMEGSFIGLFRCPGTQQWWAGMKHFFPADLAIFIDRAVNDPTIDILPSIDELPALNDRL